MCTNALAQDPVARIRAGLTLLLEADVRNLPDTTVRHELRELLVVANLVQAAVYARVSAFESRDLSEVDGPRTTRAWLSSAARLSPYAATGVVARARVLRDLPALSAAMTSGTVSAEHVSKVAELVKRVGADAVTEVDEMLAVVATSSTPADLEKACRLVRDRIEPAPRPPAPPGVRRDLSITRSGGAFQVRGQLDADAGAMVVSALDRFDRPSAEEDPRTSGQRRADALTELARQALLTSTPDSGRMNQRKRPAFGADTDPAAPAAGREAGEPPVAQRRTSAGQGSRSTSARQPGRRRKQGRAGGVAGRAHRPRRHARHRRSS